MSEIETIQDARATMCCLSWAMAPIRSTTTAPRAAAPRLVGSIAFAPGAMGPIAPIERIMLICTTSAACWGAILLALRSVIG